MIFIKGNVPSSKNSKQVFHKGNKTIVIWSKTALKYLKESEEEWLQNKFIFIEELSDLLPPYKIGFHFVRGSKHSYDFVNPLQTVQDLMVKYEWIKDDNVDILIPFPLIINNNYTSYSKENPGVFISIIK